MNRFKFALTSVRGRIFLGFAVIILLVIANVIANYIQLSQVRNTSAQIIPATTRVEQFQEFALALNSYQGNLDRYFTIGGQEFREAVLADLDNMDIILTALQTSVDSEIQADLVRLAEEEDALQAKSTIIVETDNNSLTPTQINLQIIELYGHVDAITELHESLTNQTLTQMRSTADSQQDIISRVLTQFAIVGLVVTVIAVGATFIVTRILAPIGTLTEVALDISSGNLERIAPVESENELGTLAKTFNNMTAQLRDSIVNLEQRVADRTRALEISGNVSRQLSNILDRNQLVQTVVEQVKESFNYYHAHIYLFDDTAQHLIMVGGTGEAGQQMLANKHQISAGKGLVGRAGQIGQPVLVPNTAQAEDWLPNPLLPDTKAEIAVPIMSNDRVWGVLDVQHNVTEGLSQADVDLLESIANQVAVALRNANLYEKAQEQAKREALMNEINQKIANTKDVQEAMQVAVREIGRATGASSAIVRLASVDSQNGR